MHWNAATERDRQRAVREDTSLCCLSVCLRVCVSICLSHTAWHTAHLSSSCVRLYRRQIIRWWGSIQSSVCVLQHQYLSLLTSLTLLSVRKFDYRQSYRTVSFTLWQKHTEGRHLSSRQPAGKLISELLLLFTHSLFYLFRFYGSLRIRRSFLLTCHRLFTSIIIIISSRVSTSFWRTLKQLQYLSWIPRYKCDILVCCTSSMERTPHWSPWASSDTVSCTFSYHTWQFIIFTISTITASIFSYSLSVSFWTQDLALQQIISSVDLFLSYRTDSTDSRTI